jgi:hypothetical protein
VVEHLASLCEAVDSITSTKMGIKERKENLRQKKALDDWIKSEKFEFQS